ncbi:hypothetical protein ABW19_dt0202207 [Dactylella cylindrospora]|nr:hypothetical protein ABW19_dt0202207 [Dactylella cylindrospora]
MYRRTSLLAAYAILAAHESQALPSPPTNGGSTPYQVPDYSAYKASKFIPWINTDNKNWDQAPVVKITINGYVLNATVDTGSTGIVIKGKYGPSQTYMEENCEIGHVFYTSSHWLQEGYWCTQEVNVSGVITEAVALVRTSEVCCPNFKEEVDGHRCVDRKDSCVCKKTCKDTKRAAEPEPEPEYGTDLQDRDLLPRADEAVDTAYMGVGFDRGNPPTHNLFMHVKSIDGVAVDKSYCHGYVITNAGIHMGITPSNTKNFKAYKLNLRSDANDTRDWAEPPSAVQINNNPWRAGTFLADTGIPWGYVRGNGTHKEGDNITIMIPNSLEPFAVFDIVSIPTSKSGTGAGTNLLQPTWVGTRSVAGINSGRKFYNGYDLYFDGDNGYFGLKKKCPSGQ